MELLEVEVWYGKDRTTRWLPVWFRPVVGDTVEFYGLKRGIVKSVEWITARSGAVKLRLVLA